MASASPGVDYFHRCLIWFSAMLGCIGVHVESCCQGGAGRSTWAGYIQSKSSSSAKAISYQSFLKVVRMYQKESPPQLIQLNRKWIFVRVSTIVKGRYDLGNLRISTSTQYFQNWLVFAGPRWIELLRIPLSELPFETDLFNGDMQWNNCSPFC